MGKVIYADPTGCAVFTEGSPGDQTPFTDPLDNLASIFFHSSLDYYQLAQAPTTVSITHAAVPVQPSVAVSSNAYTVTVYFGRVITDIQLLAHGLGYVPLFMVLDANGYALPNCFPIQTNTGGHREISIYATTTDIRLKDIGEPGNAALTALTKSYTIYIFKLPAADPAKPMLEIDMPNHSVIFGQGKFDLSQQRLRRAVTGETPVLDIPAGRMTDINNGVPRYVQANGTIIDLNSSTATYGGSFAGSASIPAVVV